MFSESVMARFGGIARLYGVQGLESLQRSHGCVIGIGGVGSWAAEALVRSGLGAITLIDLDEVCVTNSNRQIHALTSTVGQSKVVAMKERLLLINPECRIKTIEDFVDSENVMTLLSGPFDLVIDAIDNVPAKAAIIAYCRRNKLNLVCTGAAGGQTNPLAIDVADINKTYNDPLAAKTRALLRRRYGFTRNTKRNYGIPCVYSTQQLMYPQPDGSVCHTRSLENGEVKLDCSGGFGASTMMTASFGFTAASLGIDRLLKRCRASNELLADESAQ
ncbi:tRNA cyclic N6-threonylcarbamoyladenosine(37) synthase TcdA [Aestuariirhabdus sp. Z084]|uniref:tRNA cyclic N6-threonylcarbamoyladenosine(37) synthase TcdA n=1 Tax=Aestuariirhabdus haliotis TaxID=2918751 RepID=UPI00201B3F9D|nr:tRNA cyclic N6-threonylcarbamoyladenosine(37) synthase TcdA [Aestuariirhabdus haliotis]MCL6414862.1 tRNA cyclic N6-threonylcarbamoyladenosine(37) synthase TcdA [Aestuariirhabdus haliotis]MCL6418794.1 tRNA cyclic N6-threonylcarbamoyladenosine(37) synthase TcdA [Aestuariirhabdus haliotis]